MSKLLISKDKSLLNVSYIHGFLTNTYWANGRTLEQVTKSIEHSICVGVYLENRQIGFARILTDHIVFGYIMDVFMDRDFRGKGFSKQLMDYIHNDVDLLDIQSWYLKTGDAHELYRQFGYDDLRDVGVWMERKKD